LWLVAAVSLSNQRVPLAVRTPKSSVKADALSPVMAGAAPARQATAKQRFQVRRRDPPGHAHVHSDTSKMIIISMRSGNEIAVTPD
jgi:hypothetical protein